MLNLAQISVGQAFAAALVGLASHVFYFKQGEHHLNAPILFYCFLGCPFVVLVLEEVFADVSMSEAANLTSGLVASFFAALFESIVLYRTLFHPLRTFSGPFGAKISKIWHVYHIRNSQNHLFLDKLHRRYGTFVRTGPEEVTVFAPEAIPAVDGPGNTCVKSPWYDLLYPMNSILVVRDKQAHDMRRQVWEQAFTLPALKDYDTRITTHVRKFERYLASKQGEPIHVNECCHWLSLDVIGDLAFGKSLGLLDGGRMVSTLAKMQAFMKILGPFSPTPWLFCLAFAIPGLTTDWNNFIAWCREQMRERLEAVEDLERPDVSSRLIQHSREKDSVEQDRPWLDGDALTMLVAGSDSVANTTTFVLYELALRPHHQDTIRENLRSVQDLTDLHNLSNVESLKSFILETLRIHPAVPTGGNRKAGSRGLTIRGQFIPPWTTVVVPRWTISRLESAFVKPDEFVPERWSTMPELVRCSYAHNPFGTGRYRCVGKNLALREISYTIALVVLNYDISFAPGEDGKRLDADLKDVFSAAPGKLDLVFHRRRNEARVV